MADIKERLNAFYDTVLNGGNLDALDQFLTEDCNEHTPPPIPDLPSGREGVKMIIGGWFKAFSDLKVEVHDMVAEGDTAASRITWSGKHTGSMMGEEPTGKEVSGQSVEFMKMNGEGKFTDHWAYGNDAEVMMSLGMAPPPG